MDDARIDELLRELEERPRVRDEFEATLRDRLAGDLGFGTGARWTIPWAPLRVASFVALAALLAAALLGVLGVANRLLAPDPAELVRRSVAAYADPPAFDATFRNALGTAHRLAADGAGTWRIQVVADEEGTDPRSYDLFDGTRIGRYDGAGRVWKAGSLAEMTGGLPPYPFGSEFTWERIEIGADGIPARMPVRCDGAEWLEDASVAGRSTDHLRCPRTGLDVWLDRESHLILRLEAGPQALGWEPGATVEVTAFSLGAPADPTAFSFDGPADAFTAEEQPPSRSLRVGDAVPDVSGPLVEGGTFHTASLAGRPMAVFVWCPCVNGPEMRQFSEAVAERADRLGAAVVLIATPAEAATVVADVAFEGPAIIDAPGVLDPLELNWWPVLVLVDAEGRIASLSHQVREPAVLDAMLDALVAGSPVPSPTWIPGPGTAPDSNALEVGQPAPAWSAPTEEGGTLRTDDLMGTRTVVYYGLPQGGDDFDAQNDAILLDLDAARRSDPDLRVVVVDAVAATLDEGRAALDALAVDLPLVADRDGIIGTTWGLVSYPSLVFLDETGRVAWYGAGPCIDVEEHLRLFEEGGPMPSAVVEPQPHCP